MTMVTAETLKQLATWDTPTICNALELVAPHRRGTGFTVQPLLCSDPGLAPIVGWARTATIRGSAPPQGPSGHVLRDRIRYYEYVADGARPTVAVIQDLDPEPGFGAFWGEVNTAVHKGLGVLGVVTNGSIRDLDACAPGFQLLAGKVAPSHGFVHVVDTGGAVDVHGMQVGHDDIVHADRHGAVVIPRKVVRDIPAAVDLIMRRESVILDCVRQPDFDIGRLRRVVMEANDIH